MSIDTTFSIENDKYSIFPRKKELKKENRNDNKTFKYIDDLYRYAESLVAYKGLCSYDRDGFERLQIQNEVKLSLEYSNELENQWKSFLESNGIDIIHITDTQFFRKIKKDIDQYITDIANSIEKERLNYTNVMSFFTTGDRGAYGNIQLGWIYFFPYAYKDGDKILIDIKHELRSIDLYDGFPYNIAFCIQMSEYIYERILDKKPQLKDKLRLNRIDFHINALHAYLDEIPEKILRKRGFL